MNKVKIICFYALVICVFLNTTLAQPPKGIGVVKRINGKTICGYPVKSGFGVNAVSSNKQAEDLLKKVIASAGMTQNQIRIAAADVDNAWACEDVNDEEFSKRYILYNAEWLNNLIKSVGTDWTTYAILAHEVGHHKRAHVLSSEDERTAKLELEADEVAGEVLAKMGATLDEAKAPFAAIADEEASENYPSRAERLTAIEKGWNKVKRQTRDNEVAKILPDSSAFELSFWDSIKNSSNPDDFEAYLERYPNGQFANLAKRRTYTNWLISSDFQKEFDRQLQIKFYPSIIQGRNFNGISQFRALFIPYPQGKFAFYSCSDREKDNYEQLNKKLLSEGYQRVDFQTFIDASGKTRYQATWIRQ